MRDLATRSCWTRPDSKWESTKAGMGTTWPVHQTRLANESPSGDEQPFQVPHAQLEQGYQLGWEAVHPKRVLEAAREASMIERNSAAKKNEPVTQIPFEGDHVAKQDSQASTGN